ncbi:hypothetical protein KUV85_10260 [Nocardioides panacisoli]|uniref:hypothetical protein n=1 Tax=Nocardioides panacisoli TaxID=627624 RepID=UPI001C637257|nr:hypothetical protein [Nocardioides panacisoli]QYJ02721.1 hypothetical protein KUV85_10260 [Nocardioides panacisoli]
MGGAPSYSVGDAFNYGWTKFQANIGTIIIGVLAIFGIFLVLSIIGFVITAAGAESSIGEYNPNTGEFETSGGGFGFLASMLISTLLFFVGFLLTFVIYVGIIRASLDITYGRPVAVGTIFRFDNLAQLLLAALLVGIMVSVGSLLCYIPGLIVAFFTQYTAHFMVDKQMNALDGIKASFGFVNKNLGTLIGFYIASVIAMFIGSLVCGIGLLLAMPVVIIASAYTYRTLQGEQVAA